MVWIYLEGSTSSMHTTVLLQIVCNCDTPCNTIPELRSLPPLDPCSFPRPLLCIYYFPIYTSIYHIQRSLTNSSNKFPKIPDKFQSLLPSTTFNSTAHIGWDYVSHIYYNQNNTCRYSKQGNNCELLPHRLGVVICMEKTHTACNKHCPGAQKLSHNIWTWEDLICMGRIHKGMWTVIPSHLDNPARQGKL